MKVFLRTAWACVWVASLGGCTDMPSWAHAPSWFGGNSVAHRAPAPQTPKSATSTASRRAPATPTQPAPIQPQASSGKVRVALLLPLSGPNAVLGRAMLNAAQQAVFDAAAQNFELMPRDTGGGDESVTAAARDAIANGAQLLIGPLFAVHVPAVQKAARTADISVLTLSTDTSLATPGLYVMGFAPGAQAERIARFAVSRGLRRFAALVPGNAYGALVGQAFQLAVARAGGTIVALDTYDPARHDSDVAAHDLADKRGVIDALFLPEGGDDLRLIVRQLANAGFDPHAVRMLGTGLWDAPDTGRQAGFVAGGWYAAPDPAARQNFITAYKSAYGEEPPRLATLAYDATALAAVLAKRGARFDQASLTSPNGFAGIDGIFRLTADGSVERGLAVLEVTPKSFTGARK
jgi:branched-chain amino acid transport system substrate-binding protein